MMNSITRTSITWLWHICCGNGCREEAEHHLAASTIQQRWMPTEMIILLNQSLSVCMGLSSRVYVVYISFRVFRSRDEDFIDADLWHCIIYPPFYCRGGPSSYQPGCSKDILLFWGRLMVLVLHWLACDMVGWIYSSDNYTQIYGV